MKFGIIRFPGSCDDIDAQLAASRVGEAVILWHADRDLRGVDAVIVPGGFSYGDYLRAGAIARFAPVMEAVAEFARDGGLVLGICNGFQVLCEAHLLPGALLPNTSLRFVFRQVELEIVRTDSAFTRAFENVPALESTLADDSALDHEAASKLETIPTGLRLWIPVKHTTGRFYAPEPDLERMRANRQVLLRYAPGHNPNGSADDIAGVCNEQGNVFGLMPHPEHAVDPLTGSNDGLGIFESIRAQVGDRVVA